MVNFIKGGTRIFASAGGQGLAAGNPTPVKEDNYLSALLKLIPAEIISVYMGVRDSADQHHALTIWFWACLVTCFIFRIYSNQPQKAGAKLADVQWRSVIISTIAFFLWACAMGSTSPVPGFEPWMASAVAALFGLLAPLLVPGDPQT
jgi:hypothetical protein